MAYVHEIRFFEKEGKLHAALFDNPLPFCDEFWIKNIPAAELGIKTLQEDLELEKKYKVESLGIKPFHTSKQVFDFIDVAAKVAWTKGKAILIKKLTEELYSPNPRRYRH